MTKVVAFKPPPAPKAKPKAFRNPVKGVDLRNSNRAPILMDEYLEAGEILRAAKKCWARLRREVEELIGEHDVALVKGFEVTRKVGTRKEHVVAESTVVYINVSRKRAIVGKSGKVLNDDDLVLDTSIETE